MDETMGELRRRPAQDRSVQRLSLILDTAAHMLDESGYSALNPTAIARRADMSHAAIYRYFPDTASVVRALATRNLERFLAATSEVLADPDISWQDALRNLTDCYVEMFRTEPGFRSLRLGDEVDRHLFSDTHTNKYVVAVALVDYFRPRYDTWDRPDFLLRIEALLEIGDALVSRAFLGGANGDPFFIAEAKRLVVLYLEETLAESPGYPLTQHPDLPPAG